MSLSNFINPPEENIEPAEESESLENIISQHIYQPGSQASDSDDDDPTTATSPF